MKIKRKKKNLQFLFKIDFFKFFFNNKSLDLISVNFKTLLNKI